MFNHHTPLQRFPPSHIHVHINIHILKSHMTLHTHLMFDYHASMHCSSTSPCYIDIHTEVIYDYTNTHSSSSIMPLSTELFIYIHVQIHTLLYMHTYLIFRNHGPAPVHRHLPLHGGHVGLVPFLHHNLQVLEMHTYNSINHKNNIHL